MILGHTEVVPCLHHGMVKGGREGNAVVIWEWLHRVTHLYS